MMALSPIPEEDSFSSSPAALNPTEVETIYHSLQPLVHRLIRQYGDTPDLREDLYGVIYCLFQAALSAYDPARGVSLQGYLIHRLSTSTYSYARSQWKARQRKQTREVSWEEQEAAGQQIGLRDDDPIQQAEEAEEEQRILGALKETIETLTPRQRRAIVGRYFEGKSYERLAEEMNVKAATVRSLVRYAIHRLRDRLPRS